MLLKKRFSYHLFSLINVVPQIIYNFKRWINVYVCVQAGIRIITVPEHIVDCHGSFPHLVHSTFNSQITFCELVACGARQHKLLLHLLHEPGTPGATCPDPFGDAPVENMRRTAGKWTENRCFYASFTGNLCLQVTYSSSVVAQSST